MSGAKITRKRLYLLVILIFAIFSLTQQMLEIDVK